MLYTIDDIIMRLELLTNSNTSESDTMINYLIARNGSISITELHYH